ncbi:MAG: hypothetical protein ACO1N9_01760 [Flavobacterium sp.]
MKTLRLKIKGEFQDGYVYSGQLFLLHNSGEVSCISLDEILLKNFTHDSEEYNFLKLTFTRNDWFHNNQGRSYFKINDFKTNFNKLWKKYSKIDYDLVLAYDYLNVLQKIETTPSFDFQLYGMRIYIGNNNGLYEAPISIDNRVSLNKPISRVFDARTTQISAKAGSLMLSSNTEGLFHGQLHDYTSDLSVLEKPISKKSIRTSWSGYDVLNYETQKKFDYLIGDYTTSDDRKHLYSKADESSKKILINSVGDRTISQESLISNLNFKDEDITYSFNSSNSCYFILNNGDFINTFFKKNHKSNEVHLSSRVFKLPRNLRKNKIIRPVSTKIVPSGCIIEYFDQVVLVHNNQRTVLEEKAVTAIKTFPHSLRYKNIIAIFDGEGVSLHCMYPF